MISQPGVECIRHGVSRKIINKVELIHSLCATSEISDKDILLNKKLDDIINLLNKKIIHLETVEDVNV